MDPILTPDLPTLLSSADENFAAGGYNEAKRFYRQAVSLQSQPEESIRENYNLAATLIQQQKYAEAEPILRSVLALFEAREKKDTASFLQQEAGTIKLLVQAVEGRGEDREDEVKSSSSHAGLCTNVLHIPADIEMEASADIKSRRMYMQAVIQKTGPSMSGYASQSWATEGRRALR